VFLKHIKAASIAVILAAAGIVPAFALSANPNRIIPERTCSADQSVCYIRATINFNDPNIANGVWGFTLPANAYITQILGNVTTAFNATTTNALTIGATPTGTDFVASTSVSSTGILTLSTAAGIGLAATGNTANQTQINGGVPVYFRYTQTGTAATAGSVTIVIAFAKNNDK